MVVSECAMRMKQGAMTTMMIMMMVVVVVMIREHTKTERKILTTDVDTERRERRQAVKWLAVHSGGSI